MIRTLMMIDIDELNTYQKETSLPFLPQLGMEFEFDEIGECYVEHFWWYPDRQALVVLFENYELEPQKLVDLGWTLRK